METFNEFSISFFTCFLTVPNPFPDQAWPRPEDLLGRGRFARGAEAELTPGAADAGPPQARADPSGRHRPGGRRQQQQQ